LHYQGDKVFNYNVNRKILHLLNDFGSTEDYTTKYQLKCYFDNELGEGLIDLPIRVDSLTNFNMPDGSMRQVKYVTAIDTFRDNMYNRENKRKILDGIGFLNGQGFGTHEWSIDDHVCDQIWCFPEELRCFSNDSVSYNFVGYPCDSIFQTTSIDPIPVTGIKAFPNPSHSQIMLNSDSQLSIVELYSMDGELIYATNTYSKRPIDLPNAGMYLLKVKVRNQWVIKKVVRI